MNHRGAELPYAQLRSLALIESSRPMRFGKGWEGLMVTYYIGGRRFRYLRSTAKNGWVGFHRCMRDAWYSREN